MPGRAWILGRGPSLRAEEIAAATPAVCTRCHATYEQQIVDADE
jgi:hypothetical protein